MVGSMEGELIASQLELFRCYRRVARGVFFGVVSCFVVRGVVCVALCVFCVACCVSCDVCSVLGVVR